MNKRERPKVNGEDAERFLKLVENNERTLEERVIHLKKCLETTDKINKNSRKY
jgi:hypothetical protein